jgi:DNA-binding transcriptional ArsR family regulator
MNLTKGILMTTSTKPKTAARMPTPGPIDFRRLAERLKQVSDLTRLLVLLLLDDGERSVGALRTEIACSMTALSRHLALLRLAGLVVPRRDGQRNVYTLTGAGRDLRRVVAGVVG